MVAGVEQSGHPASTQQYRAEPGLKKHALPVAVPGLQVAAARQEERLHHAGVARPGRQHEGGETGRPHVQARATEVHVHALSVRSIKFVIASYQTKT